MYEKPPVFHWVTTCLSCKGRTFTGIFILKSVDGPQEYLCPFCGLVGNSSLFHRTKWKNPIVCNWPRREAQNKPRKESVTRLTPEIHEEMVLASIDSVDHPTAASISIHSGLSKPQVYKTLDILLGTGRITRHGSHPATFKVKS